MQGTRLPDAVMGEPGPGWEAWENGGSPGGPLCAAGSYMKVTSRRQDGTETVLLYIKDPNGNIGSCRTHTLAEHDDGTITVSPSILGDGYHGWLERGVWREC